jgi:dihydrofolate reductase
MSDRIHATVVVAVSQNGVIGRDNALPWRLRSDLQRFKSLTMGHALIMGRKTFESIGKVLPGRTSIVLTRTVGFCHADVLTATSLNDALSLVPNGAHPFIIGGGQVFSEAMPRVNRIMLTKVCADIEGDAFFDDWNRDGWNRTHHESIPAGERDEYPTEFEIWERS